MTYICKVHNDHPSTKLKSFYHIMKKYNSEDRS
ncbi:hypothetical protein [Escherichia phage UPEC06]|nr:hypothetical protein [Escherichia phage UPEC06]